MAFDYPSESKSIQSTLAKLGLFHDRLANIGAFVVAYGLFETSLERALWALTETNVDGIRPFTETLTSEKRLDLLKNGNLKLTQESNLTLNLAAQAAADLSEYRNSLIHGQLVSFGDGTAPSFFKNTAWHGEVRNKRFGDAHTQEPLLDLVLIATWDLFKLMNICKEPIESIETQASICSMKSAIDRAKSYANEARHISLSIIHEKY